LNNDKKLGDPGRAIWSIFQLILVQITSTE